MMQAFSNGTFFFSRYRLNKYCIEVLWGKMWCNYSCSFSFCRCCVGSVLLQQNTIKSTTARTVILFALHFLLNSIIILHILSKSFKSSAMAYFQFVKCSQTKNRHKTGRKPFDRKRTRERIIRIKIFFSFSFKETWNYPLLLSLGIPFLTKWYQSFCNNRTVWSLNWLKRKRYKTWESFPDEDVLHDDVISF